MHLKSNNLFIINEYLQAKYRIVLVENMEVAALKADNLNLAQYAPPAIVKRNTLMLEVAYILNGKVLPETEKIKLVSSEDPCVLSEESYYEGVFKELGISKERLLQTWEQYQQNRQEGSQAVRKIRQLLDVVNAYYQKTPNDLLLAEMKIKWQGRIDPMIEGAYQNLIKKGSING